MIYCKKKLELEEDFELKLHVKPFFHDFSFQ